MKTQIEIASEMLRHIHRFYPVGMDALGHSYNGAKEYAAILERKVNEMIAETPNSWTAFVESIRSIPGVTVYPLDYQFPSYIVCIEVENVQSAKETFRRSLVVSVSLLFDGYTFFYEDIYYFTRYQRLFDYPVKKVVSINSVLKETGGELMDAVCSKLAMHFPDHESVDFKLLFSHKVTTGFRHSDNETDPLAKSPSIYNLLFDPSYSTIDLTVCL